MKFTAKPSRDDAVHASQRVGDELLPQGARMIEHDVHDAARHAVIRDPRNVAADNEAASGASRDGAAARG